MTVTAELGVKLTNAKDAKLVFNMVSIERSPQFQHTCTPNTVPAPRYPNMHQRSSEDERETDPGSPLLGRLPRSDTNATLDILFTTPIASTRPARDDGPIIDEH